MTKRKRIKRRSVKDRTPEPEKSNAGVGWRSPYARHIDGRDYVDHVPDFEPRDEDMGFDNPRK